MVDKNHIIPETRRKTWNRLYRYFLTFKTIEELNKSISYAAGKGLAIIR
jgi:hypothetical protein